MTEVTNVFDTKDLYYFHDLIVPGGKIASLCLVNEPFNKNLRISDIADHFKFIEPQQVIVLIGANTRRKVKLFAGILFSNFCVSTYHCIPPIICKYKLFVLSGFNIKDKKTHICYYALNA